MYVDFSPLPEASASNDIVDVDDRTVSLFDPVCGVNTKLTFTGCTKNNGNSLSIALSQLQANLEDGYNSSILLLDHCSPSETLAPADQFALKIGQILEAVRNALIGLMQHNQIFLEFAIESTKGAGSLQEPQWKSAEFFDEILQAALSHASLLQMLRIKVRVQGKFVCFFSLICLAEASCFLYGEAALGRLLKEVMGSFNSAASACTFAGNSALKALFDNAFCIVLASCSCSSELTKETVALLSLLEGFSKMKQVLFPNNNSYELLDEYQETSLEVVEALEGELQKIYLVKDAISKELVAVNNEFLSFQSFSKEQFERFVHEEKKRMEAEQLLAKASLECLMEQVEETQSGLLELSRVYQADIQKAGAENAALSATNAELRASLAAFKAERETLQEQIEKLTHSNKQNASLLSEAQKQLSKLQSEHAKQQELASKTAAELQSKLEQETKRLASEHKEAEESFRMEIEQLQAKVEKSVECNKATQTAIKSLTREKAELVAKLDEANEKCTSLQEEIASLTEVVRELKKIPKRKPSDEALSETLAALREELEAEREAHSEAVNRLEREVSLAKSSASTRLKRIERDLEDERENVHTLAREKDSLVRQIERLRELSDGKMSEDVKEAVNRERAAVKSERIEMRSLLKESQDKILELQDELRKAHNYNQRPAATHASSKPIDFLLSQQLPIHEQPQQQQPKRAKPNKQKSAVVSDEEPLDDHLDEESMQNVHSNKPAQAARSRKTAAHSTIPLPDSSRQPQNNSAIT